MNQQLVYRYITSLSKNENMFKKSKTKRDQKREKKSPPAGVKAQSSDVWGQHVNVNYI